MTPGKKARLLIVDDEVPQMQALRDTLQDQGYEVVACSSGEAAVAALRQARFDLIWTTSRCQAWTRRKTVSTPFA